MNEFKPYLDKYKDNVNYQRMVELIKQISVDFPYLKREIKWNQPMFINNTTFIFAFSCAKNHISIAVEKKTLDLFTPQIKQSGYSVGKMLFQIKSDQDLDYDLLKTLIEFNIEDKKKIQTFWRK